MTDKKGGRRNFLQGVMAASGLAAVPGALRAEQAGADIPGLPPYARALSHKSLKQSSYDRTGGNSDRWPIAPGR